MKNHTPTKEYKPIQIGEPIRVSGWALVHADTKVTVISGEKVYTKHNGPAIHAGNGTPPQAKRDGGTVWCPMWDKEFVARRFGLRWVKLDSEGEPLY